MGPLAKRLWGVALSGLLTACGGGGVGATQPALIEGTVTEARPEIGEVIATLECTGTLITPFYVLTAAHCVGRSRTVEPGHRFLIHGRDETVTEFAFRRYAVFSGTPFEKLTNGLHADVALLRLDTDDGVPATLARPVPIANARPRTQTDWSTRFGYGCTDRSQTREGTHVKRFFAFQGISGDGGRSNVSCSGDSGGPILWGNGVAATPLWGVGLGTWTVLDTWDVDSDAVYHKKQIEGLIRAWDGPIERGIDRPGADLRNVPSATAEDCQHQCLNEFRCRAWTHVRSTCFMKDAVPNWVPGEGASSGVKRPEWWGGAEQGFDRTGSDYRDLELADSASCRRECARDHRCEAYAFRLPGPGRCWLKDTAPDVRRVDGVISAAKRGLEMNTLRAGRSASRFNTFDVPNPSPEYCQAECAKDDRCRAWTYLIPFMDAEGGGHRGRCTLMDTVPTAEQSDVYISGVKGSEFY